MERIGIVCNDCWVSFDANASYQVYYCDQCRLRVNCRRCNRMFTTENDDRFCGLCMSVWEESRDNWGVNVTPDDPDDHDHDQSDDLE